MRKLLTVAVVAMAAIGVVSLVRAADPKEIKEVMKEAHKDGLLKKVTDGKAEQEDKDKLLALYKDLAANKPPQGDEKVWETRTKAIVTAAEGVAKGDKVAMNKLKTATNCAASKVFSKPNDPPPFNACD